MTVSLKVGNSLIAEFVLMNPLSDDNYVNDATVNMTISELTTEVWPKELPYVSGSNGVYQQTFEPFVGLVAGVQYAVVIDSVGSDGLIGNAPLKFELLMQIATGVANDSSISM